MREGKFLNNSIDSKTDNTFQGGRNYGIDLLRIVSMLMIVMLHVLGQGGIIDGTDVLSFRYEIAWILKIFALCSVNCYALITGYVGVDSKHRYSNLVSLWLQVVLYTVSITALFGIIDFDIIGKGRIIAAVFPVMTNQYWYFTAFFILSLFSPLLNSAIHNSSKPVLKAVVLSLFFFVTVIFPIFRILFGDTIQIYDGYSAIWLMVLYLFGAYIKKYGLFERVKQRTLLLVFFLSSMLTWGSKWIISIITVKIFGEIRYDDLLVSYISVTMVVSAVTLLLFFSRLNIRHGKRFVSWLSAFSFGVFLIHTHPLVFEYVLKDRFRWVVDLPIYLMIPVIIGSTLLIFTACSLIDCIRFYLFKTLKIKPRLNQLEDKISGRSI